MAIHQPNQDGTSNRARVRALFRSVGDFGALLIGIVSGVAGLAGVPAGFARLLLELTAIACVLFLVIRMWHLYYVVRNRNLRKELEKSARLIRIQQEDHQRYLDAIERIIDRETPLFEDTLEVTVIIGKDDEGDEVIEEWHTTPNPRVTHRAMRPIVPNYEERVVRLEEIDFKSEMDDAAIMLFPLVERIHYLRVWLVFDPPLTKPVDWTVRYSPKGLWSPLRERGWDKLGWVDRLPTANGQASSLTHFVVRFVFPGSERAPGVNELRGCGTASPAEQLTTGQWQIIWQDPAPAGRHYQWELTQSTERTA